MECLIANFKTQNNSGELQIANLFGNSPDKLKSASLDELLDEIYALLQLTTIGTDYETSANRSKYEESIVNLIDTIINKLNDAKELISDNIELNNKTKEYIRTYFNNLLLPRLPRKLTKVDEQIHLVLKDSDLISLEEVNSLNFKKILREVFGNDLYINSFRLNGFNNDMKALSIIDVVNKKMITDVKTMNEGIRTYLSNQYLILRNFLIKQSPDYGQYLPQSLFRNEKILSNRFNAFLMMYNHIKHLQNEGTFEELLEQSWYNFVNDSNLRGNDKSNSDLYEAVCAYVNLRYFDENIRECFGKLMQVNANMMSPIEKVDGINNYKYQFASAAMNEVKNNWTDDHNALDEIAKFSELIITSIDLCDHVQKTKSKVGKLLVKDFVGATSMLRSKILLLSSTHNKIKEWMNSFSTTNSRDTLKQIFKTLFDNNSKTLRDELIKLGLDQNHLDYLYSIYVAVFAAPDGHDWNSIEQKHVRANGFNFKYSPVDTIIRIMNSNVMMEYLETNYDSSNKQIETKIKQRYTTNRTKFDIIRNINNRTLDREDRTELLQKYKVERSNNECDISLTFGGKTYSIRLKKSNSLRDILNQNGTEGYYNFSGYDFKIPDLSLKGIRLLLSGDNLTDSQKQFMSILSFIDDMLFTSFHVDESGLKEFKLLAISNDRNFKNVFLSAVRALVVNLIYHELETGKDKDDKSYLETYGKTNVFKFLTNTKTYDYRITDGENIRSYFFDLYGTNQLKVISNVTQWVDDLSQVRAMLLGDTSKSVIPNLAGDKIANYSPTFLGARLHEYLIKSATSGKASSNLLFSKNSGSIKRAVVNTDIKTQFGIKKSIQAMTAGELIYDSIFNKFIIPLVNSKFDSMYTQPTTYSDKTKFILYEISLKTLGLDTGTTQNLFSENAFSTTKGLSLFELNMEKTLINTIGKSYLETFKLIELDYQKLFNVTTIQEIQTKLKSLTENDLMKLVKEYNNLHPNDRLEIFRDLHYRKLSNGKLSLNELVNHYANYLYTPENLHERLASEKLRFINNLVSNSISFTVKLTRDGNIDVNDGSIGEMLNKLARTTKENWIDGNKLILAKVKNKETGALVKNITYSKVKLEANEFIELNPILSAYFYLDNLIGNNLRMSLTGTEANHPAKVKINLQKHFNPHKSLLEKYGFWSDDITLYDISLAVITIPNTEPLYQLFKSAYNNLLHLYENNCQNTQLKRNVIIPGTIKPYTQNMLTGIRNKMKIAVIDDVIADVFNFDGIQDKIQAHDGAALENPFISILENYSLIDDAVGTVKKPIHHDFNDKYVTATLLKYAVDTITNQWMRQSEGNRNGIRLRNLFKKMTNVRWHILDVNGNATDLWKFGPIDLMNSCQYRLDSTINFTRDILKDECLYYSTGYKLYRLICDFARSENGHYYTIELDVDAYGSKQSESVKVYHYFNNNGEHFTSTTELSLNDLISKGWHAIDSLFELHTAMGGIYSMIKNSDGVLQYSEKSNEVVVNFINSVAIKKDPNAKIKDLEQSQLNYYQPLKEAMIDMVANNTSIKEGAGNVNSTKAYYDESIDLQYIEIETKNYGIQMDADHHADEAKMTEFSLVISSLDTGGRLHDYVSGIYQMLGDVALKSAEVELEAVAEFERNGDFSKLYEIIGRAIINNLSSNKGQAGLLNSIMESIEREFGKNTNHKFDINKIPFSDYNVYHLILSNFISAINNKSIKRKYPGTGTVMVPGYDLAMIYELNGIEYQFEDVLKEALSKGYNVLTTDIALRNRQIVENYLNDEQNKMPEILMEEILPTDNVVIYYIDENNVSRTKEISLNSLSDYYRFKNGITTAELENGTVILKKGRSYTISLNEEKDLLEKDRQRFKISYEGNNRYSIHFSTGGFDSKLQRRVKGKTPLTEQQKIRLFRSALTALPTGATLFLLPTTAEQVSTKIGGLTQGSIAGYTSIANLTSERVAGIDIVGTGKFYDVLYFDNSGNLLSTQVQEYVKRGHTLLAKYKKNIMVPRNLAPAKIYWNYIDQNGNKRTMNIFDHLALRELYEYIDEVEYDVKLGKVKKDIAKLQINAKRKELNILRVFDLLETEHIFFLSLEEYNAYTYGQLKATIEQKVANGSMTEEDAKIKLSQIASDLGITTETTVINPIKVVGEIHNKAAEIIMSNIYKSRFNIKDGDSLTDILKSGEDYFFLNTEAIGASIYNIAYTKFNNENLYITFNPVQSLTDEYNPNYVSWKNPVKKEFVYPDGYSGKKLIVSKVYAQEDHMPLFEVGREIYRYDLEYNSKGDVVKKGTDEIVKGKFSRHGDRVVEYIEFVSKYDVVDSKGKYKLYNINTSNIRRTFAFEQYSEEQRTRTNKRTGESYIMPQKQYEDDLVNKFVGNLLGDIYQSEDFNGIQIKPTNQTDKTNELQKKNDLTAKYILTHTLHHLGNRLSYDKNLQKLLQEGYLTRNDRGDLMLAKTMARKDALYNYYNTLKTTRAQSFLKSLYVTASRIPAQTLQSFMQMKVVGFTGVASNQCFVSHFLTFLLGSKILTIINTR